MTEEKLEAEIRSILDVWVTGTDDGHGGYAVEGREEATEKLLALLSGSNPWRYPSRGKFPDTSREVAVSVISEKYVMRASWDDELGWIHSDTCQSLDVYAWRELPEPAPEPEGEA